MSKSVNKSLFSCKQIEESSWFLIRETDSVTTDPTLPYIHIYIFGAIKFLS